MKTALYLIAFALFCITILGLSDIPDKCRSGVPFELDGEYYECKRV